MLVVDRLDSADLRDDDPGGEHSFPIDQKFAIVGSIDTTFVIDSNPHSLKNCASPDRPHTLTRSPNKEPRSSRKKAYALSLGTEYRILSDSEDLLFAQNSSPNENMY